MELLARIAANTTPPERVNPLRRLAPALAEATDGELQDVLYLVLFETSFRGGLDSLEAVLEVVEGTLAERELPWRPRDPRGVRRLSTSGRVYQRVTGR